MQRKFVFCLMQMYYVHEGNTNVAAPRSQ